MSLDNQVVFVTGASSGTGEAISRTLAGQGAAVVLTARRRERLERIAAEIEREGGKALVAGMDLTKGEQIDQALQRTMDTFGRLDVLINNAGIGYRAPLADMSPENIRAQIEVNLIGLIECTRKAIPFIRKQDSGAIINVASKAGLHPTPNMAAYGASKWGVRGFTFSLAEELKGDNIRVFNLCPGRVDTGFFDHLPEDDTYRQQDPDKMLKVQDVADAVLYLLNLSPRVRLEELTIGARKMWLGK